MLVYQRVVPLEATEVRRFSCLSEELRDDERVVKAAVARFLGADEIVGRQPVRWFVVNIWLICGILHGIIHGILWVYMGLYGIFWDFMGFEMICECMEYPLVN